MGYLYIPAYLFSHVYVSVKSEVSFIHLSLVLLELEVVLYMNFFFQRGILLKVNACTIYISEIKFLNIWEILSLWVYK